MLRILLVLACLVSSLPAAAQPVITLGTDSVMMFASRQQASEILAADDAYTARMSPFDRMLRLKSTSAVNPAQYAEHAASNALAWSEADQARLRPLLLRLSVALSGYRLSLPASVLLIKTTGREDIGQGHTRANAIVLPLRSLADDDETLFFLIAHELFHVMTRHDGRFRAAAYALVGFRVGREVALPAQIAPLQITNPDAPRHDSFIEVRANRRAITVIPVLLSRSAVFDPEIGYSLGRYWSLRLLAVEPDPVSGSLVPQMQNGAPVLFTVRNVDGFVETLGGNTDYIIHAEEVLAEHFALMISGGPVDEPQQIEALRRLLMSPESWAAL